MTGPERRPVACTFNARKPKFEKFARTFWLSSTLQFAQRNGTFQRNGITYSSFIWKEQKCIEKKKWESFFAAETIDLLRWKDLSVIRLSLEFIEVLYCEILIFYLNKLIDLIFKDIYAKNIEFNYSTSP